MTNDPLGNVINRYRMVTDGNGVRAIFCVWRLILGAKSGKVDIQERKASLFALLIATILLLGCRDNSLSSYQDEHLVVDQLQSADKDTTRTDAQGSEWPQLFGPERNCFSQETDVNTQWDSVGPRELWRVAVGNGYSSPVVKANSLILMHRRENEEIVESFDCDTGSSRWRFAAPTKFVCKYEYSSGPYSTPVVWRDRVFVIGAAAQLRCLDSTNGSLVWHRDLQSELALENQLFGFGASPWIEDGKLILNVGASKTGAGIVAFDCSTGDTLWTATDHRPSYATPIATTLFGQRYLFVLTYEGLVALDPADGRIRWIEPFKSKSIDTVNATSPAIWKNFVVVMHGPGAGAKCFKVKEDGTHELAWKDRRVLDSQFNSLLSNKGYLYGFTAKREGGSAFRCVNFETGQLQWSVNSELQRGSCIGVHNRIILWGEEGHLAAMDSNPITASNFKVTDSHLLEKPCYAAPALASKRLFLRNEHYLIALDLSLGDVKASGN